MTPELAGHLVDRHLAFNEMMKTTDLARAQIQTCAAVTMRIRPATTCDNTSIRCRSRSLCEFMLNRDLRGF